MQDFLKSLYQSPGDAAALQAAPWTGPNGQGMPGEPGTMGGVMPGGGVMAYPATTPGAPSMGYPAVAGPLAASSPPSYDPLSSIRAPSPAPVAASLPTRPVTPTAPAATPVVAPRTAKGAKMRPDLGMNPRFTTVQSQIPQGARGGPLANNSILTALNLGA
jgi:hypothetical protein